jgi:hypothetical protein
VFLEVDIAAVALGRAPRAKQRFDDEPLLAEEKGAR